LVLGRLFELQERSIVGVAPVQEPLIIVQQNSLYDVVGQHITVFFVEIVSQHNALGCICVKVVVFESHEVKRLDHLEEAIVSLKVNQ
jgi:hypothetical protein